MDVLLFALSVLVPRLWLTSGGSTSRTNGGCSNRNNKGTLQTQLEQGTSLNAKERVCTVTANNVPIYGGHDRATMRLNKLWHRATYCLIIHQPQKQQQQDEDDDVFVLVQKRSSLKDYCPSRLDPTPGGVVGYGEEYVENIVRELQEEMGIVCAPVGGTTGATAGRTAVSSTDIAPIAPLQRLFTFPFQDDRVRVWGEFFVCTFQGELSDLTLQMEEVEQVLRMSLKELQQSIESCPPHQQQQQQHLFMPDSVHAMKLFFQYQHDRKVQRRFLKGSSSDLEAFGIRPTIQAIFFDCDDCLYFDNWKTANKLTSKIDEWCVNHGLVPGQAYELYKRYGTALRGLLAEGYLEDSDAAIRNYLEDVHDIGVEDLIKPDPRLHAMLSKLDPSIPKYIFTASVEQHARKCIKALGIDEFFQHDNAIIDCLKCDLETKHSVYSFQKAMQIANIALQNPEACVLLDDSVTNIQAARQVGWRACLVGKVGRDCGQRISSDDAELELDTIHDMETVFPELFPGDDGRDI